MDYINEHGPGQQPVTIFDKVMATPPPCWQ